MASLIGYVLGTVMAQSAGVQDRQAVGRSGLMLGITGLTPVGVVLTTVMNRQEADAEAAATPTTSSPPPPPPSPEDIEKAYLTVAGDAELVAGTALQLRQEMETPRSTASDGGSPSTTQSAGGVAILAAPLPTTAWTTAIQVAELVEATAQHITGTALRVAAGAVQPLSTSDDLQNTMTALQSAVTGLGQAVTALHLSADDPVTTAMTHLQNTVAALNTDLQAAVALTRPS